MKKQPIIKKFHHNNRGFTLIETLLYMALVGLMMSYLTPLAWNAILGNTKVVSQQELSTQARYVSERIRQEIRNASDITTVSATSITLAVTDSTKNPTIIDLSSGKVRVKWGSSAAVNLNSDNTTVTSLAFTNYSTTANTRSKHIGFTFTMNTNYGSQRKEYFQTINMRSSAEVRSN